jgi:hypothetical protein
VNLAEAAFADAASFLPYDAVLLDVFPDAGAHANERLPSGVSLQQTAGDSEWQIVNGVKGLPAIFTSE